MAYAVLSVFCQLSSKKPAVQRKEPAGPVQVQRVADSSALSTESGNIVLQPRLCTLRSDGGDRLGVVKTKGGEEVRPFFETLTEYIESSRKSQDFETICGRLAMVVFAATVTTEVVTGNTLFRKMDIQGIAKAAGVCLRVVTFAAIFAWFSGARGWVSQIFSVGCNTFIDSLIDQIVDGLFYDNELSDLSDEI